MASSVLPVIRRAFGADMVPGIYRDLDEGRPDRARRLQCGVVPSGTLSADDCREERARHQIGRYRSAAHRGRADAADLFLPIAPGMDTALFFAGYLPTLADTHALNDSYIAEYTRAALPMRLRARPREIAGDAAAAARASPARSRRGFARFF